MERVWDGSVKVLSGFLLAAMYAMPQAYTISARPGAVNYIEGNAFLNGSPLSEKGLKSAFLNANDTLSTDIGKAEVLLTPGVFLRIGDNSRIRMISPSLTHTQLEVSRGEAMIEAAGLLKDNNIEVINHGGSITIEKNGLYRFTGDDPPTAAVLDGKAQVYFGDQKIELGRGHETVIGPVLKAQSFDRKKEDELYAWSNVRSEYGAAASYQSAKNVASHNSGTGWDSGNGWGYGYAGWYGPGWYWNNGFNTWAWLPGSGAFYSPFGWGFYSPGTVLYAPVVIAPVYRGGYWNNGRWAGQGTTTATVAVSPKNPPAPGIVSASPSAYQTARAAASQSFAQSGFRTASGAPPIAFSGNHASYVGAHAQGASSGPAAAHASGGGWSGAGGAVAASRSSGGISGTGMSHGGGGHR
jgi:hypothetical protein